MLTAKFLNSFSSLLSLNRIGLLGGRLENFWKVWEDLEQIHHLGRLQCGVPSQTISNIRTLFNMNSKHPYAAIEIKKMQNKGALEKILHHTPGFHNSIFLVPKKTGDVRPVVDLKLLNAVFSLKVQE